VFDVKAGRKTEGKTYDEKEESPSEVFFLIDNETGKPILLTKVCYTSP
jgi:hypothetical protein